MLLFNAVFQLQHNLCDLTTHIQIQKIMCIRKPVLNAEFENFLYANKILTQIWHGNFNEC